MSNYVGCSQYSIFCYVGFFLKIVDWKKKKKKLSAAAFLLNFLWKRNIEGSVCQSLRGAGDLLIFEREMVIYTQKKNSEQSSEYPGGFFGEFFVQGSDFGDK